MTDTPYLSVVVAARNDDHGGNMLGRMQAFLEAWIYQAERYNISTEVVIVEWNAPPNRPRLIESLRWPRSAQCAVRIIDVPGSVHQKLPNPERIPLHQMIAKNAGIRRARGEFVLATNLDIICSAELMRFFAEKRLEKGRMYRIDRDDVSEAIPAGASVDDLLAYCQRNPLRIFASAGELDPDGMWPAKPADIAAPNAGIRFGSEWYVFQEFDGNHFRWMGAEGAIAIDAPTGTGRRLVMDVEKGPSAGFGPATLDVLDEAGSVLASVEFDGLNRLKLHIPDETRSAKIRLRVRGATLPLERDPHFLKLRAFSFRWETNGTAVGTEDWLLERIRSGPGTDWTKDYYHVSPAADRIRKAAFLHTNACGDFTLLHREDWIRLRGYAEFPIWPMHIDALLCYAAYHAGIQETVLARPMRIFHIQHGSAAGWSPAGQAELDSRVKSRGVNVMSYRDAAKWIDVMRRFNAPAIFTTDRWGMADEVLDETTV